jgi:putative tricarboxylic transport membrane protein
MIDLIIAGFSSVFTLQIIILIFIGVAVGIVFGAIPGLTAGMAVALCLPVTFGMEPIVGISLLCGLYIGGISGGLISAILLKIPGTPASIATTFDGYPLAQKGQAGKAIGVGVVFSFLGTFVGIMCLIFIAPNLASVTIKFGPVEYFATTVFSLTMVASLSGKSLVKGFISAGLGMTIALVGMAPIDSSIRYTFGVHALDAGFTLLAVCIGLFAISEVLDAAKNKHINIVEKKDIVAYTIKGFGFSMAEFRSQIKNMFIAAMIGTGIGILPGIGGGVSNIVAYTTVKNQSKYPEKFGTGIIDGVVASEAANNATIGGAMIPLLTLGIPGDTVTAMMLGGFLIHGISPGPLLFKTHGVFVYGIFAAMLIATVFMLVIELGGLRFFVKVLQIPQYVLLPVIVALCSIGAYGTNNRVFDVICFALFGILGFFMQKMRLPLAPIILGFILGPMAELNLRRGLQYNDGNIFAFFEYPIAVGFFVVSVISMFFSVRSNFRTRKALEAANSEEE